MAALTQADIRRLFALLNEELRNVATIGELFLVGGATMCLAYAVRPATQAVDAVFRPAAKVREAAARVGARAGLRDNWLNDGVKGLISACGEFAPFLALDHLRVMVAQPEYLLAMKCLGMRIGAEFHDEDDVRYLLRHLDIRDYDAAIDASTPSLGPISHQSFGTGLENTDGVGLRQPPVAGERPVNEQCELYRRVVRPRHADPAHEVPEVIVHLRFVPPANFPGWMLRIGEFRGDIDLRAPAVPVA